jgi:hypothetical protein
MRIRSTLGKVIVCSLISTSVFTITFFFYIVYQNDFDIRTLTIAEPPMILVLCYLSFLVLLVSFVVFSLFFYSRKNKKSVIH